jgi:Cdc6-like AAA superfamily ATPase
MTAASSCWAAWTWWKSAGRRTAASRPEPRRQRSRAAPVHPAHRLWRETGDADLRPRSAGATSVRAGLFPGRSALASISGQPHGIILVTGPTGSGKTTTLYSTLKQLATDEVNVCTIEDPIEMIEPSFNQMQVQPGIDLNFAAGCAR